MIPGFLPRSRAGRMRRNRAGAPLRLDSSSNASTVERPARSFA